MKDITTSVSHHAEYIELFVCAMRSLLPFTYTSIRKFELFSVGNIRYFSVVTYGVHTEFVLFVYIKRVLLVLIIIIMNIFNNVGSDRMSLIKVKYFIFHLILLKSMLNYIFCADCIIFKIM